MTCIISQVTEHSIQQSGVGRPKEILWLQCGSDRRVPDRVNAEASRTRSGPWPASHHRQEQVQLRAIHELPPAEFFHWPINR